jgi:hypothetical protein
MFSFLFASVHGNYRGFCVSIFEIDNKDTGKILLHSSVNSDKLDVDLIADNIAPVIENIRLHQQFSGVYCNANSCISGMLKATLKCGGRDFRDEGIDIGKCLNMLAMRINSGELLIKDEISRTIKHDLMNTHPNDVSNRLMSLIQIMESWNQFKHWGKHVPQSSVTWS